MDIFDQMINDLESMKFGPSKVWLNPKDYYQICLQNGYSREWALNRNSNRRRNKHYKHLIK